MTHGIAEGLRANTRRAVIAQAAFVLVAGALVALSRRYFDLHIGVPGHTGLLWMFLLVYSRGLVDRPGAGVLIGVSAALWLEPLGAKHTLPYNLLLHASVGSVVDVMARAPFVRLATPAGGLLAGAFAHAGKYGFILAHAKVLALPKNFLLIGVLESFGLHLLFGAVGGLAAGLVIWANLKSSGRVGTAE